VGSTMVGENIDCLLIRLSSTGATLWTRTWGGSGRDVANSVIILPAGDIVFCGDTDSFGAGSQDAIVMRVSPAGVANSASSWEMKSLDDAYQPSSSDTASFSVTSSVRVLDVAVQGRVFRGLDGVQVANIPTTFLKQSVACLTPLNMDLISDMLIVGGCDDGRRIVGDFAWQLPWSVILLRHRDTGTNPPGSQRRTAPRWAMHRHGGFSLSGRSSFSGKRNALCCDSREPSS
jgi:hypothetical protein